MGFTCLAGLAFLFAIREVLISMFCTIAFLEIGVLLAVLFLVVGIGISFFHVFSVGGIWGLIPLLTLLAECAAIYLAIRFGLSRIMDADETPLLGG
jgi:hypothetical protein